MKITITRAENGFIADADGKIYIGATPAEAIKNIIKGISDTIMGDTASSGDKYTVELTARPDQKQPKTE